MMAEIHKAPAPKKEGFLEKMSFELPGVFPRGPRKTSQIEGTRHTLIPAVEGWGCDSVGRVLALVCTKSWLGLPALMVGYTLDSNTDHGGHLGFQH